MKVSEMIEMTRKVVGMFDESVGKWNIDIMLTELTGEVGTLADSVMIKEEHRLPRNGEPIDLADDIADIMFMLIRIADHYEIDIEEAYKNMIDSTHRKLEDRLRSGKYLDHGYA